MAPVNGGAREKELTVFVVSRVCVCMCEYTCTCAHACVCVCTCVHTPEKQAAAEHEVCITEASWTEASLPSRKLIELIFLKS